VAKNVSTFLVRDLRAFTTHTYLRIERAREIDARKAEILGGLDNQREFVRYLLVIP
jgi:hypothetical protein